MSYQVIITEDETSRTATIVYDEEKPTKAKPVEPVVESVEEPNL